MENVLLVFGGDSYEHDISIITASQIYNKTKIENIAIISIYISKEKKFYYYNSKTFNLLDFKNFDAKSKNKSFKEVAFVSGENCKVFLKNNYKLKEFLYVENIIFACHGGVGENGELLAFFKQLGFGVSVGDVLALGLSMNKFLFKKVMQGLNIPVVKGFKITKSEFDNSFQKFNQKFNLIRYPLIIKSNRGGSSIGLFIVKNKVDLKENLKMAFEFDDEVLIERYCQKTREFNIAILGTTDSFVLSEIDEPMKMNEVLTFADKYESNNKGSKIHSKCSMASQCRRLPAEISLNLRDKIRKLASKIFVNLKLSGIVRMDFLYQEDSDKLFVCEINSIPGSLAYYFFEENLITVNALISSLLKICHANKYENDIHKKDFYTNVLS